MPEDAIVLMLFLIFAGAAVVSTLVLFTRQSLLVAYILLGVILGPWGLYWIPEAETVRQIGNIGIIFLLFLLGLHLQPQSLFHMLKKVTLVAVMSSLVFWAVTALITYYSGFTLTESFVIGVAMIFSSTIIGLKLLPTTILHHQHIGELMISVLLMQDLFAILVLLGLQGAGLHAGSLMMDFVRVLAVLPLLIVFAFIATKYVLLKLLARFDRTQEYVFILSIGWCLSMAMLAKYVGLSDDIGAFVAGVALAVNPISLYVAESLKPLRDFFLVMFFFSVGASLNMDFMPLVLLPASILAVVLLIVKPLFFTYLLRRIDEKQAVASEVAWRLGQGSEFTILVGGLAVQQGVISLQANYFLLTATILTFVASSYIVVLRYPTPIALSDRMRRD
jgi:Kef-type K+ transport system membrane component KefB